MSTIYCNYLATKDLVYSKKGKIYLRGTKYELGGVNQRGYKVFKLNSATYKVHRMVFYIHYGRLPKALDHIDGNKLNNKIENLREASASQNCCNKPKQSNNTSGFKGVSWSKQNKSWKAEVTFQKKRYYLGHYTNLDEAGEAARLKRVELHGEFYHHE